MEKATFGAGCFWGVEEAFRKLEGVTDTKVGYAGGDAPNPSYEDVCTGKTGHAEVVQVMYDPEIITFEGLLDVFFNIHDPTQVNRQGPDTGTQYRTIILCHDDAQEQAAKDAIRTIEDSGRYKQPVATEIEPLDKFWTAEEYHQQYLEKRGMGGCHI